MTTARRSSCVAALFAAAIANGCGGGGGGGGGGGEVTPSYQLTITSPTAGVAANGVVPVKVAVTGGEPASVELVLVGEGPVPGVTVGPPDYACAWDTRTAPEGLHQLKATVKVGTRVYESAVVDVLVDRTEPRAPELLGASVAGAAAVPLHGTAEGATTLRIFDGTSDEPIGVVAVPDAGAWAATVQLTEGAHSLSATSTDRAGNASARSPALAVMVDVTAPESPRVDEMSPSSLTGELEVSGTAEAGSTVTVYGNGIELGHVVANGGAWILALQGLGDGPYSFVATATDVAGHVSAPSAPVMVVVDTSTPFVTIDAVPAVTNAATLRLTGAATAGAQVRVVEGASVLAQITAASSRSWAADVALTEGTHLLTAIAKAPSGAESAPASVTVRVDRQRPTVVSRSPLPGDADAWSHTPIVARFSEPVQASTVNDGSVFLVGGGSTSLVKTLHLSADGRELTVTPAQPPALPTALAVTLTATITDLAGNALVIPPDAWSWYLHAWQSFGYSPQVYSNEGSTYARSISTDAAGTPFIMGEYQGIAGQAYSLFRWEEAWSELWSLHDGRHESQAAAIVDAAATPTVAWWQTVYDEETRAETAPLRAITRVAGAWSSPVLLSDEPGHDSLVLALDPEDRPVAAWRDSRWDGTATQRTINVARRDASGWTFVGPGRSVTGIELADLSFDGDGAPILAWKDAYDTVAERWTGSSWEALNLGYHCPGGDRAEIRIARTDSAFVGRWEETAPGTVSYSVVHCDGLATYGRKIGTVVQLDDPWPPPVSLALDTAGLPVIVWREQQNICGTRWDGVAWRPLASAEPCSGVADAFFDAVHVSAAGGIIACHGVRTDYDESRLVCYRYNG